MQNYFRAIVFVTVLLLSACSTQDWNEKLSNPRDRSLALSFIDGVRKGNIDPLAKSVDRELLAQTRAQLPQVRTALAVDGRPELITVNSSSFTADGNTEERKALNYQYGGGAKWVIFQVVLQINNGVHVVIGWQANPANVKPTSIGDFSFVGKGFIHYLWIVMMVSSFATIITALVLGARSKGIKRRWLWMVGSVFGLGQFALNWSTGQFAINPIYFSLLGAGLFKTSPFHPWMMMFSLPVVAVAFLVMRKRLLASGRGEQIHNPAV